jgi:hypothetical protein
MDSDRSATRSRPQSAAESVFESTESITSALQVEADTSTRFERRANKAKVKRQNEKVGKQFRPIESP